MTDTTKAGKDVDGPRIRPFAEFLTQLAAGKTHGDLSDQLHELVTAVSDTGKGGSLTLTVEVKPLSKGDDLTLTVTDKVTLKLPKRDRAHSVFFRDGDGNLVRNDPRQATLPLREVEDRRRDADLREAGAK